MIMVTVGHDCVAASKECPSNSTREDMSLNYHIGNV